MAWKTGTEALTHATPVVAVIHGVRQVVFLAQSGLVSVEAASGKPFKTVEDVLNVIFRKD